MELSLIIPLYNEETRIQKPLLQIYRYLKKNFTDIKWELILVNDGSKDATKQIVENFIKLNKRVRLVHYKKNQGKGYAISRGVKDAKGKYIFFMDIDLSVKPKEVKRAFTILKKTNTDVIIASRRLPKSVITVHQPWLRETMGHFYTILATTILKLPLTDLTCGCKGFKRTVAQDIFKRLTATRWSFDAEVLYKAHQRGYAILEIPVTWEHVGNSKVNIGFDAVRSFIELVKIRLT